MSPSKSLKREQLILSGPLTRAILTLALPIMLNNLIASLYNIGDAYWVSKLGDVPLAAINFVWPVSFLTFSIALGISVAGGSLVSQYVGAGKIDEAKETAQQLYVFGVLFGIVSFILGWLLTPTIVGLMNATGALYDNSVLYLRVLFIEMPFLFLMNIFFSLNQATGDTITPTVINGTSAVINIIIDPIFIFALGLGIQGAALATVLSKVPFAIYGVYKLSHSNGAIRINPMSLKINKQKMLDLIKIGAPSSMGTSGVAVGFIVLFAIFASYGDYAMTAVGIGNRLNGLAFMPALGVGAALSTITGQNLGAGNIPRIKKAYRQSIVIATVILSATCLILWFFSYELIGIFSQTPEVLELGGFYVRILALSTWSIGFFHCSVALFNGSGHTIYSMLLEGGRLWVIRLPLVLVLGKIASVDGIWYSVGLSNIIASAIAILLTFNGAWKHPKIRTIIK